MFAPEFIIIYVANVSESIHFYDGLIGKPPVEASPNFAMYAFENGTTLGLWAKHDVQPIPKNAGGGAEMGFTLKTNAEVDTLFKDWSERGYSMAQKPLQMDFGYTFTALDPDGHRLRVFATAHS
jgi:catechol 2,3-dioxygenase-like lactoylglutathione lyase family enzyme